MPRSKLTALEKLKLIEAFQQSGISRTPLLHDSVESMRKRLEEAKKNIHYSKELKLRTNKKATLLKINLVRLHLFDCVHIRTSIPAIGVEPILPRGNWILNPARLPIPPRRHNIYF